MYRYILSRGCVTLSSAEDFSALMETHCICVYVNVNVLLQTTVCTYGCSLPLVNRLD